jgi:hypothetical protein
MNIPEMKPAYDFDALCEKCANEIITSLNRIGSAQVNTQFCATGGYPIDVIKKVGKLFADKKWFVYLMQGHYYKNNFQWLIVGKTQRISGDCGYPGRGNTYLQRIK